MESGKRGFFWFQSGGEVFSFAQWLCFMAIVGVPIAVALIWGAYNPNNMFSVIGISARRGTGAFVNETRPVGESLLNGTSGQGFRPGQIGGNNNNRQSLRPGENNNNNGGFWYNR